MINFSMNFENDMLTSADVSYRKTFGHVGFVLEKMGKYVYFQI